MLKLLSNKNDQPTISSTSSIGLSKISTSTNNGYIGLFNSRKAGSAQAKSSGLLLKNKDSTLKYIAKKLSLTSKRKSDTNILPLKDINFTSVAPSSLSEIHLHHQQQEQKNVDCLSSSTNKKQILIKVNEVTENMRKEENDKLILDLGIEVATIVLKIVEDFSPVIDGTTTSINLSSLSPCTKRFCGQFVPPISLSMYLSRLIRNISYSLSEKFNTVDSTGVRCLLMSVIYIERLRYMQQDFQINILNVHRLFFIAIIEAFKVNEDFYPGNNFMAQAGGIDLKQLNMLESTFCIDNDFHFIITIEELQGVYQIYYDPNYIITSCDKNDYWESID